MKKLPIIICALLLCLSSYAQVYINEVMTNNQNTVMDSNNDYSDWIEIYNPGPASVSLAGYYLSDNIDSLMKWQFPAVTVLPDSFIIVWCSGKNRFGNTAHTNFSLDSQGETIFLSDTTGTVVDNLSPVFLVADKTFGRLPDGSANLAFLSGPTFKSSNNNSTIINGLISTAPVFDIEGGFYVNSQSITITHPDPSVTVHYTLDGSDPTESSPVVSGPIFVQSRAGDTNLYSNIRTCYQVHFYMPEWYPPASEVFKCTVVRARAFKNGFFPGPIQTHSYFIDPSIHSRYGNFPVVSVVSDPKNLFSDSTGIYVPGINYQPGTFNANYYNEWDRPANIEMYMPGGVKAFNSNFKISIGGQSTPSSPQKTLNVNASSDYGVLKIDYPLFANTPGVAKYIRKFDKIKFRAWGSDRGYGLFRDAYCASFFHKSDLDYEAYQPVVVFIDGEYWGIQEMRERNRNSEYYESHYFIDKRNPGFDILDGDGDKVIEGDSIHWNNMMNFIISNPLSIPSNYDYIKTQLDVNNFMINYMASIYFSRGDWPDQNEGKWRPRTADGKWRWMLWDMDNTTGYYLHPWYDMFPLVFNGARGLGPSEILNNLTLSDEFKYNFINLFADYMNTEFLPPIALAKVDGMRSQLLPQLAEFQNRWQLNYNWQAQTDSMKWWMNIRPQHVKQHILNNFSLTSVHNLTIQVSDTAKGNVKVNTIFLDNGTTRITAGTYPWTGQYFSGIPVPLTASAKPGYRFIHWQPTLDTNKTIFVNLLSDTSFTAMFDIDPGYQAVLNPVINEVMSANATAIADNYGQFDDWLEIYNPNADTLDLAGYFLTDNLVLRTRFKIGEGNDSTKIPPYGFLLIWIDNDTKQGILHTSFKFSSSGDFIALVAPDGNTIVDSISIQSLSPDVSFGRKYDAAPQFINFFPSTPGATNWLFTTENILINELQTINVTTIPDNYGEYNQWIELYNPNPDTLDIAGWKITNDPFNIIEHQFPHGNDSTKIAPGGFKLLWADNDIFQGILHLSFALSSNGCITLMKPNDAFSDSACYSNLTADVSYGRVSDGSSSWRNYFIPTPDSNNVLITSGLPQTDFDDLKIFPNPVFDKIYFSKTITFDLYDVLGKLLTSEKDVNKFSFKKFARGVYFLKTDYGKTFKIVCE